MNPLNKILSCGVALPTLTALAAVDARAGQTPGHTPSPSPLNKLRMSKLERMLEDRKPSVRAKAIQELRALAARVDRMGRPSDRVHPPQASGLFPYLVRAAEDKDAGNRSAALYALADTRDPAAAAEIRKRLKDPNASVRFDAACLLTEFQDASGLAEMKQALKRLLHEKDPVIYFCDGEMLMQSFERITRLSMGQIPGNPIFSSQMNAMRVAYPRYHELLSTWAAWWNRTAPHR